MITDAGAVAEDVGQLDLEVLQVVSEPSVVLTGMGACLGTAEGKAYWVYPDKNRKQIPRLQSKMSNFPRGAILLALMTSPDLLPVMRRAAGIVTCNGGRTCHAAIVSRELGILCVVGVGNKLEIKVVDGMMVRVKGDTGEVEVL